MSERTEDVSSNSTMCITTTEWLTLIMDRDLDFRSDDIMALL